MKHVKMYKFKHELTGQILLHHFFLINHFQIEYLQMLMKANSITKITNLIGRSSFN